MPAGRGERAFERRPVRDVGVGARLEVGVQDAHRSYIHRRAPETGVGEIETHRYVERAGMIGCHTEITCGVLGALHDGPQSPGAANRRRLGHPLLHAIPAAGPATAAELVLAGRRATIAA